MKHGSIDFSANNLENKIDFINSTPITSLPILKHYFLSLKINLARHESNHTCTCNSTTSMDFFDNSDEGEDEQFGGAVHWFVYVWKEYK